MSKSKKEMTMLSPSRIKVAKDCSWIYHCKYKLKLPDMGNPGSSRGTICHLVFECLGVERHRHYVKKVIDSNSVYSFPALRRLVFKHAKKFGILEEEHTVMMEEMIINGLKYDFFGKMRSLSGKEPDKSICEQQFHFVKDEGEYKRYSVRGFIDRLFLYDDSNLAIIRDYKSSKSPFNQIEKDDNLQDLIYTLAVKELFPDYKNRRSEFLFLRFPLIENQHQDPHESKKVFTASYDKTSSGEVVDIRKINRGEPLNGVIYMNPICEDEMEGLELYLSDVQRYIDNFDEESAQANFAKNKGFPKDNSFTGIQMCGWRCKFKGQLKKDGTKAWHCPFRFEFDYYEIYEKETEKTLKTFYVEEQSDDFIKFFEDVDKEKYAYRVKTYEGCPAWKK